MRIEGVAFGRSGICFLFLLYFSRSMHLTQKDKLQIDYYYFYWLSVLGDQFPNNWAKHLIAFYLRFKRLTRFTLVSTTLPPSSAPFSSPTTIQLRTWVTMTPQTIRFRKNWLIFRFTSLRNGSSVTLGVNHFLEVAFWWEVSKIYRRSRKISKKILFEYLPFRCLC